MNKIIYKMRRLSHLIKSAKRDFALDNSNAAKIIKLMELGKDVSSKNKMGQYVSFCKENKLLILIEGKPSLNMGVLVSWIS